MSPDFLKNKDTMTGILILIIFLFGIFIHNVLTSNTIQEFGYCKYFTDCQGFSLGSFCVGLEAPNVECINPLTSNETYRLVEVKCALSANTLCQDESIGENWPQHAVFEGKTCQEWKNDDERIKLISCKEIFPNVQYYSEIK